MMSSRMTEMRSLSGYIRQRLASIRGAWISNQETVIRMGELNDLKGIFTLCPDLILAETASATVSVLVITTSRGDVLPLEDGGRSSNSPDLFLSNSRGSVICRW